MRVYKLTDVTTSAERSAGKLGKAARLYLEGKVNAEPTGTYSVTLLIVRSCLGSR